MKISKADCGRQCEVWFSDIGTCTGILIDCDPDNPLVFSFYDQAILQLSSLNQITQLGQYFEPKAWDKRK